MMTKGPTGAQIRQLPAAEGAELTDPGADQLPVILQLAAEAGAFPRAGTGGGRVTRRARIGPAEPEMAGGGTCSTGLVLMQQAGLEPEPEAGS
jgi:hypothetical protein